MGQGRCRTSRPANQVSQAVRSAGRTGFARRRSCPPARCTYLPDSPENARETKPMNGFPDSPLTDCLPDRPPADNGPDRRNGGNRRAEPAIGVLRGHCRSVLFSFAGNVRGPTGTKTPTYRGLPPFAQTAVPNRCRDGTVRVPPSSPPKTTLPGDSPPGSISAPLFRAG